MSCLGVACFVMILSEAMAEDHLSVSKSWNLKPIVTSLEHEKHGSQSRSCSSCTLVQSMSVQAMCVDSAVGKSKDKCFCFGTPLSECHSRQQNHTEAGKARAAFSRLKQRVSKEKGIWPQAKASMCHAIVITAFRCGCKNFNSLELSYLVP